MSKQKWVPVREDYWGFLNVERNGTVLSVSLMADFEQENGYSIVPLPDDLRLCRLVDAEDAAGVSDEVKAAIDTLCQVNEYHSAARVLHAWLAAMETQPQQPQALDMPDGPGWWAFEGKIVIVGAHEVKVVHNILEWVPNGELPYYRFADQWRRHTFRECIFRETYNGKWTRLTMPWDIADATA